MRQTQNKIGTAVADNPIRNTIVLFLSHIALLGRALELKVTTASKNNFLKTSENKSTAYNRLNFKALQLLKFYQSKFNFAEV